MAATLASHVLAVVFAVASLISITVIWNIWLIHTSRKRRGSICCGTYKKRFVICDPELLN